MKARVNLLKYLLLILVVSVTTSCHMRRNKMRREAARLEKELNHMPIADTATASQLVAVYKEYAKKYPRDSMAPEYLYRSGNVRLNTNDVKEALELFSFIPKKYPHCFKAPYSLFMQGYIYENYLKEYAMADQKYNIFLTRYPSHIMAREVRNILPYLGEKFEEPINSMESWIYIEEKGTPVR